MSTFTAGLMFYVLPRDAMLARYLLSSCVRLSVGLSLRPCVTSRSSSKMVEPRRLGSLTKQRHTIAQGL